MTPKVGQYLHASCSAEDYGRIIAVGEDANGAPCIDIEIHHPDDLIFLEDDDEFPHPALTELEAPEGVKLIMRDLQWRPVENHPGMIVCRTPGNGCYRCTKLFTLHDQPQEQA